MPEDVIIPRSLTAVADRVEGAMTLMSSNRWLIAACVTASTYDSLVDASGKRITVAEFAKLGIRGLEKVSTVQTYRQTWLEAQEAGEVGEAVLGHKVTLPDREFPGTRTGTDGYSSLAGALRTIERIIEKHGIGVLRQVLVNNEEVANAVMSDTATSDAMYAAGRVALTNDMDERRARRSLRDLQDRLTEPARMTRDDPPDIYRESHESQNTNVFTHATMDLGIEVGINQARRIIRHLTKELDAVHVEFTEDDVAFQKEQLDLLRGDIQMLEAVIEGGVSDAKIAAFLKEDV